MSLGWLRPKQSSSIIGLDIESDSIKLLKINSAKTPFEVEAFGTAIVPPDAVVKGELKNPVIVGDVLKQLFRTTNVKGEIACAMPKAAVITKNVLIDKRLSATEIEKRAWIEANHHFPDLVGEIYLDFNIIGTSKDDPNQLEMMLVACRKDKITPYLETLKEAGLSAKIIDVNSFALERALAIVQDPALDISALLNLDTYLSTLVVTHKGELIFSHDHSYEGQRVLTQINKYLYPENEPAKPASLSDAAYLEILKNTLTPHLRHIMHFFYSSRPQLAIQKIFLTGECSLIPDLANFIKQEVGIETALADPFAQMTFQSGINVENLKKIASSMMLCCGLALSGYGL